MKTILKWLSYLNPLNLFWIVDPCSLSELTNSTAACFKNLSPEERLAARVYYLWLAAQACASVTSDLDTLLITASCYAKIPPEQLDAISVLVAAENASAAGASVAITIAEAATGIKCLKFVDMPTLKSLETWLRCKLSGCL